MENKHRIIVAGGAGFIGKSISTMYANAGHDVLVLDNFSSSTPWHSSDMDNLQVINCDITDYLNVWRIISEFKPTVINNHAALASVTGTNCQDIMGTNLVAAAELADMAAYIGADYIFASSGAIFGECFTGGSEPKIGAISIYGKSKQYAEDMVRFMHSDCIILRYSNVYGFNQNTDIAGIVSKIFEALIHKGADKLTLYGCHVRDFIYIADVVSVHALIISDIGKYRGLTYNISTGIDCSLLELYQEILMLLKCTKISPRTENITLGNFSSNPFDPVYSSLPKSNLHEFVQTPIKLKDGIYDMALKFGVIT